MDSFLDTTVILKYIEYSYILEYLRKKCFEYIQSSTGKIFISILVEGELQRVIIKRKEMYENVLKKIKDSAYQISIENTNFLNKEDILFTNSLYLKLKEKNPANLKKEFDSEIGFLNVSVSLFLKNKIDEIGKKEELDKYVLSVIHEFITDFADCRVLTSAVQMQQDKEQFLFVTADQHIDPGGYNFIEEDIRLEKYKKPKLKNFLFEE